MTSRQKLLLFCSVILVGNALIGYAIYETNRQQKGSEQRVEHTRQVIAQSGKILLLSKDIVIASCDFINTDDSALLKPLYHSKQMIPGYIAQLTQLTIDNPRQQSRIELLSFHLSRLLFYSFQTLELRSNTGVKAGTLAGFTRAGIYEMRQVQKIIDEMNAAEGNLPEQRKLVNNRRETAFNWFLALVFILTCILTFTLLMVMDKRRVQNEEKEKRAAELVAANKELAYQSKEKEKRAEELIIANKELIFQNEEKEKRAAELVVANKELAYQSKEKEKRADELIIANKELVFQNEEKEKRAAELVVANKELAYQSKEKEKRADELIIANKELIFQNEDKEKRAAELVVANVELIFQNGEKEKRAAEFLIANRELTFQNGEKEKRAAELMVANQELAWQNDEKEKRRVALKFANEALKKTEVELQQSLKSVKKIMDSSNDVICCIDEHGKFTEVSAASEWVWGYKPAALTGNYVRDVVFSEDLEKTGIAALEVMSGLPATIFENRLVHKNGNIVFMLWSAKWDDIDRLNYCIGKDISARKLAEKERAEMLADLVFRNKDLEQFTYIVSHNLRAPVANIIGASNVLNTPGLPVEKRNILGRLLSDSVAKLDDVIKDLHDILQVKSTLNEKKEKVVFSKLVENIKSSISNLIDKDSIVIEYNFTAIDELVTLKSYLYSIFYNLISNSIKYRQAVPCHIVIKSTSCNGEVELTFTDNGMGIDLIKNSELVFGLYKRFNTSKEGKGMGLFMVKTQVETLGGKIEIKSAINKGTTFMIKFSL